MVIISDQVIRDRDRNRRRHRYGRPSESHPLQPDKLTTRIRTLEADLKALFPDGEHNDSEHEDRLHADVRAGFRYGQPYDSKQDSLKRLWEDKQRYDILMNDGGRPAFNIEYLVDVSRSPKFFFEPLRAWLRSDLRYSVFYTQLFHWHDFRIFQRYWRREDKLPQYMKSLQDRLASHVFTRTYQLDDDFFDSDPARQGKLATWIEYLMYGDIEYLKAIKDFRRSRKSYKAVRMKLIESKLFTESDLRFLEPDKFLEEEKDSEESLKADEEALKKHEEALKNPEKHLKEREKYLKEHEKACVTDTDRAWLDLQKNHEQDAWARMTMRVKKIPLVRKFREPEMEHRLAKEEARRHQARMNWIHHQIHAIELELGMQLPEKVIQKRGAAKVTPKTKGKGRKGPKRLKRDKPLHHQPASSDAVGGRRKKATTGSKLDKSQPRTLRRSSRAASRRT